MKVSEEQALFRQTMAGFKGMVALNHQAAPSEHRRAKTRATEANAPTAAHYPKNATLASAENAAQNAASEVQNRGQARTHAAHSIADAMRAKQPLQHPSSHTLIRANMPAMRQTASEPMAREAALAYGSLSKKHARALKNSAIARRWQLDLHGATKSEATAQMAAFLHEAQAAGTATVCVIHGKGTGTLKGHVSHLLRQTPCVRAFCSAAPNQGGTGALMVALKSPLKTTRACTT